MEQFDCDDCGAPNNIDWTDPNEKQRHIPCTTCCYDECVPPIPKKTHKNSNDEEQVDEFQEFEPIRHGKRFKCTKGEGVIVG